MWRLSAENRRAYKIINHMSGSIWSHIWASKSFIEIACDFVNFFFLSSKEWDPNQLILFHPILDTAIPLRYFNLLSIM